MSKNLPDILPGHWETPDGAEMAALYANRHRCELMGQCLSDMVVANKVFLNPDIMTLTVAKDRIRWLSVQLALANIRASAVAPLLEEARDLLMEKRHGNPARSAGHNARLAIEAAIARATDALPADEETSISTPGALR